jgi:hypothetical protein
MQPGRKPGIIAHTVGGGLGEKGETHCGETVPRRLFHEKIYLVIPEIKITRKNSMVIRIIMMMSEIGISTW